METMTHTPLNVDLKKMDYETFKTFMRELAQMYSNVKDDAYLLFYHNLRDLAKEVSTLPRNPLIFYGAYEIANNQVVVVLLLLLLLAARLAGGFAVLCLSQCGGSQKQEYAQNCDPFHMHVVLILMFKGLIV